MSKFHCHYRYLSVRKLLIVNKIDGQHIEFSHTYAFQIKAILKCQERFTLQLINNSSHTLLTQAFCFFFLGWL